MNTDEKYRLSIYRDVSILSEEKNKRIYIVKDEATDRLYVKKIFQGLDNIDFYKRLTTLEHKNLATIHDVIKGDNEIFIIEDFINGQTLRVLLNNNGVLQEKAVIDYISQVCDALAYLHNLNPPIIHRDIKPENIICSTDNIIKLIDFDIAREFKEASSRDTVFMGTKEYAAPEQYGYKQTDCRADIYSVGVLMHELLTGKLPKNNITYRGALRRVIDKCIEIDPQKRFQNILLLKKALIGIKRKHLKKLVATAVIVVIFTGLILVCIPSLLHYIDNNKGNKHNMHEIIELDLFDLFIKIESGEEKPSVLLKYEEINKIVQDITEDLYDDVVNAFQEYIVTYPYPMYYDQDTDYLYLPACNTNGGYIHDWLLFEMDKTFLSIAYFDADLETTYYFTTNDDKGLLTPDAFYWIKSYHFLYENPVVFNEESFSKNDVTGVYYIGNKKKIEIFEDGGEMKFSYTDIKSSSESKPLITDTIYKIDENHYWMKNVTSGNKNRLIFNFTKNHLILWVFPKSRG